MVLKTSIGITETNDNNQNTKTIFSPETEIISVMEKSHEVITVPKETSGLNIGFGTGITTPKLIVLKSFGDLTLTLGNGTNTIELPLLKGETYRLPTGIISLSITNVSTVEDVTLEKIIAE